MATPPPPPPPPLSYLLLSLLFIAALCLLLLLFLLLVFSTATGQPEAQSLCEGLSRPLWELLTQQTAGHEVVALRVAWRQLHGLAATLVTMLPSVGFKAWRGGGQEGHRHEATPTCHAHPTLTIHPSGKLLPVHSKHLTTPQHHTLPLLLLHKPRPLAPPLLHRS